jgi:protein phosphatase 1G
MHSVQKCIGGGQIQQFLCVLAHRSFDELYFIKCLSKIVFTQMVATVSHVVRILGDTKTRSALCNGVCSLFCPPLCFVDDEEENVENLYEEAEMPLEQVMAKYQNDFLNPNIKKMKQDAGKQPVSPILRGRRSCSSGASTSGSGSCSKSITGTLPEFGCGKAESGPDSEDVKERDVDVGSSSNRGQSSNSSSTSRQHSGNSETDQASDSGASNGETKPVSESSEETATAKHKAAMPDSSGDVKVPSPEKGSDCSGEGNASVKVNDASDVMQEVNGEIGDADEKDLGQTVRDCDGVTSSSVPHENGEVVKSGSKGKSPAKVTKEGKKRVLPCRHTAMKLYRTLLGGQDQSDSDSDDEGDESFQGADDR